ncbi:MAG: NAD(P)H-binding protein [Deinococcota bacterium]
MGCTGTLGCELMQQLVTAPHTISVRGVLRRAGSIYPVPLQTAPKRVSYVTAKHNSVAELSRAFAGADALFLLTGTSLQQVEVETCAVEAAQRAGVRRIIKLSAPLIAKGVSVEVASWHRQIEAAIESTGLEHCFLRPYAFMQNWLRNTHSIRYFGKIVGSAGNAARNYVDARDVAAVAAQLLLSEAAPVHKALTLQGPEAINNEAIAERLSNVTGGCIDYENLSFEDHYELLVTRANLPDWLARHIVELEALAVHIPESSSDSVTQCLAKMLANSAP